MLATSYAGLLVRRLTRSVPALASLRGRLFGRLNDSQHFYRRIVLFIRTCVRSMQPDTLRCSVNWFAIHGGPILSPAFGRLPEHLRFRVPMHVDNWDCDLPAVSSPSYWGPCMADPFVRATCSTPQSLTAKADRCYPRLLGGIQMAAVPCTMQMLPLRASGPLRFIPAFWAGTSCISERVPRTCLRYRAVTNSVTLSPFSEDQMGACSVYRIPD